MAQIRQVAGQSLLAPGLGGELLLLHGDALAGGGKLRFDSLQPAEGIAGRAAGRSRREFGGQAGIRGDQPLGRGGGIEAERDPAGRQGEGRCRGLAQRGRRPGTAARRRGRERLGRPARQQGKGGAEPAQQQHGAPPHRRVGRAVAPGDGGGARASPRIRSGDRAGSGRHAAAGSTAAMLTSRRGRRQRSRAVGPCKKRKGLVCREARF